MKSLFLFLCLIDEEGEAERGERHKKPGPQKELVRQSGDTPEAFYCDTPPSLT